MKKRKKKRVPKNIHAEMEKKIRQQMVFVRRRLKQEMRKVEHPVCELEKWLDQVFPDRD